MKSKRAIFVLETREWLALSPRTDKKERMMHIDDVEYAIELAEQDAEQRALKAFCVACTHYVDFSLCERKICPELEEFRQLIRGQDDE